MEHVRWSSRPRLRTPIVIAAFAGWNDAGEAASTAARHLADVWATRPFATIDPEEFYDFSSDASAGATRRRRDTARSCGPSNEFSASSVLNSDLDVVVLIGTEPQQRWRTFCAEVLAVATELERAHAHHDGRAARRGPALPTRLGDRHRRRRRAHRPIRPAALALRGPDRHRRSAPRRVRHRRPRLAVALGGGAGVRAGRALAEGGAGARRAGRPTCSSSRSRRRRSRSRQRPTSARSTRS